MIDIKYQATLFGSYNDIMPKPDTLKYFIDSFSDKELIPTTFQEIGPNGVINRFNLNNSDETWQITFGTGRIDIFHTNRDIGVSKFLPLDTFIDESKSILDIIEGQYPRKHHRLSLVTRCLLDEMTAVQHNEVYHKLNSSIDIYRENSVVDWNSRTVTRIPVELGTIKDTFNIISNIKRNIGNLIVESKKTNIDRIELNFDINTFQGNLDYRFQSNEFKSFIDESYKIEQVLRTKYIEIIES